MKEFKFGIFWETGLTLEIMNENESSLNSINELHELNEEVRGLNSRNFQKTYKFKFTNSPKWLTLPGLFSITGINQLSIVIFPLILKKIVLHLFSSCFMRAPKVSRSCLKFWEVFKKSSCSHSYLWKLRCLLPTCVN